MMNSMPKISVIMGIYNCAETLREAVMCIVNQTYTEWELILCDDGSADGTYKLACELQAEYPSRIIVLKNEKNCGLNHTLNRCLKIARGEFIARMDGDDLCSPNRFAVELQAFDEYPEIAIVSTAMEFFDETGVWGIIRHPEFVVKEDFFRGSPFCHAPCMVRKEAFDRVNGYSEEEKLLRVEDYHLWMKMYEAGFRGMNIQEPYYQMRDDRNAFSRRKFKFRVNEAYVKALAVKKLGLPKYGYVYALRPILVGMLPESIYKKLHKMKLNKKKV